MMELMDDCGLRILNGNKQGDWNREVTQVGYNSKSIS